MKLIWKRTQVQHSYVERHIMQIIKRKKLQRGQMMKNNQTL